MSARERRKTIAKETTDRDRRVYAAKRDYGPPIRRSQRLTTASEEPEKINQVDDRDKSKESENPEEVNAVATAEGTEPEEPARLALGENRAQDTLLPSIEEPENNNLEEAADELPLEQKPNHTTRRLLDCIIAKPSHFPSPLRPPT